MMSRHICFRAIHAVLALGTCAGLAASQDLPRPSTTMVARQQWGTLAEEIVAKLSVPINTGIWLTIRPASDSGLAQNAFLDALVRRGYAASLTPRDSADVKLTVTVLTDQAFFKEIGPSLYQRSVQADAEARTEANNGKTIAVLGTLHRAVTDTVAFREGGVLLTRSMENADENATLFQRIVGPLVVLASGVVIIYLFFTVRS